MNNYLQTLINAVFTGIGTGIGSYFATKYVIEHFKVKEKDDDK